MLCCICLKHKDENMLKEKKTQQNTKTHKKKNRWKIIGKCKERRSVLLLCAEKFSSVFSAP